MAARETAETLLGGNPDLWRVYFMDCLKWVDTEEARELWEDLERILGEIGPECAGRYFSYLASKGEFDEAQALWEQVAREVYGKPWDEETDRFWNGSFDHPIAIEGGLEWRIDKTMPPGVRAIVSSLKGDPRSGSLKIHFDGEENTVFHHVDHWFFVEPGQTYRLHYRVSTMSITTDSGPYVLLSVRSDPALNIRGEMVKGTGEWEFTEEFTVPANGRHAWIEIRRDKSTKPNNRIEGDVWYDDFSLELADTPTADRLSR